MRLGELKAQALMLMYPDLAIRYGEGDMGVEDALFNLKSDPSFEGLTVSMTGSVNRAFSLIEARGLSPVNSFRLEGESICPLPCKTRGTVCLGELIPSFLSVEKIIKNTKNISHSCSYELLDGKNAIVDTLRSGEYYTVVYKSRIERVSQESSDLSELLLDEEICGFIPYYIKGELFAAEDEGEAKRAMELFNALLDSVTRSHGEQKTVLSLYSQEAV